VTFDQRVQAVTTFGFTERQAAFLVTVMLHAGVCLGRHYCTFAGLAYGRKMHDFFERVVTGRYGTAQTCRHNKARLYHIHNKRLYAAIGEPDNRHRKPTAFPRAVERLMVLDAVLANRDRTWLATESDKLAHFTLNHRVPRPDLPSLTFRADDCETVRYFPDKLPIAVDTDDRGHLFVYLVTRLAPVDFRAFLERHVELLRALPVWTLRLLVPRHLEGSVTAYHAAFREHVAMPLRPGTLEELRWYFRARQAAPADAEQRFDQASRAFSAPRFQALYRAWVERGDPVLEATLSPVLRDAIERRSGRIEHHVLPHHYLHLSPLVGTA
jgi:hypothetical protein